MAETRLADRTLELLSSGVSIYLATADASLRPECSRGAGVRVHPDRRHITVYLATSVTHSMLDNLAANGRIAVTCSRPFDHRTVQIKGKATAVRPSGPEDREEQLHYRAAAAEQLAIVGVPRSVSRRFAWWPSVAIEVEVTEVFDQT